MNKIKILFISHSSGMLGAEKSLLLLLKNINRNRFDPIVVLPANGPLKNRIESLGIRTYKIRSPWWVSGRKNIIWAVLHYIFNIILEIIALFRIYKIVKLEKINLIYTNTIVNFTGAVISFLTKKPHIWHIREIISGNPDIHFLLPNKILFNFILRFSNKIIANSNASAKQFLNNKLNKKIEIVYNAVDIEEFKDSNPFPDIGGVKSKDWLIAVVGSLQKRKAQDDAVKAVKIVKDTIPNVKLLLIGDGNKEFKNYLKRLVFELDVSNNVIFTGYRDDVLNILRYCRLLLFPSLNEPFGRVVIEAMAVGIPVIGINSGGVKEIIQDSITGYLVLPHDPLNIAKKIIYLFNHPELAKKMGIEGKKIVKEKFNVQNYAKKIEKIIQEIMKKQK